MSYQPGKHLIATIHTQHSSLLESFQKCRILVDELILKFHLHKLGEVYHDFTPGGFTAVVCLSESHLSIHTWPEYGKVNLDIYLSNFQRNNDNVVQQLFDSLQSYFQGETVHVQILTR